MTLCVRLILESVSRSGSLLLFKDGKTFDAYLTKEALTELCLDAWRQAIADAACLFKQAMIAAYVLIGGGGERRLQRSFDRGAAQSRRDLSSECFVGSA
jgi:hypothetical protein